MKIENGQLVDVTSEENRLILKYAEMLLHYRMDLRYCTPSDYGLGDIWKAFSDKYPWLEYNDFILWALLGKKREEVAFGGVLGGVQSVGKATYDAASDVFHVGLSKISWQTLESLRNAGRKQMLPEKPLVIAIDIGGVISKHPDVFRRLFAMVALPMVSAYVKLLVMTDMSKDKAVRMLADNNIHVTAENVYSADYDKHGELCKAELCKELGVDVLIDDQAAYVSVPGAPAIRLFLEPDAFQPYYHPTWITKDGDGKFGRVVATKREVKHDGASKPKETISSGSIDDHCKSTFYSPLMPKCVTICGEQIPICLMKQQFR